MINMQQYDSSMNKSFTKDQTTKFKYAVNFNIFYETTFGEELYVVGSLPELGKWKEYKLKLYWGEGHIWTNKEPLLTNHPFFEYKYTLHGTDGGIQAWESGVNRIACLETLPSSDKTSANMPKLIYIQDVWQEYKIRFTIFDPLYEPGDEMFLSPNPDSGLSNSMQMHRTQYAEEWLTSKYGKPI